MNKQDLVEKVAKELHAAYAEPDSAAFTNGKPDWDREQMKHVWRNDAADLIRIIRGATMFTERNPEIIELIQSKAREILEANGHKPKELDGCLGDIFVGNPLWVYWPLRTRSWVEVHPYVVLESDCEIHSRIPETEDDLIVLEDLVPGYRDMQKFLGEVTTPSPKGDGFSGNGNYCSRLRLKAQSEP